MNDNENNIDLNEEELNRVSNALDALQKHNTQPTTNAWEAIMEESNRRSSRLSRRTQLLSAAAAVTLILAITGTALVMTRSGNPDEIKSVDKKKKEKVVTTTTVPLTEEEQALKDTFIFTKVVTNGTYDSVDYNYTYKLRNGLTGKEVKEFDNFIDDKKLTRPTISFAGGNYVRLVPSFETPCDEQMSYYFNLENFKTSSISGDLYSKRVYSPSENKYAEIDSTCSPAPDWKTTMTIVDLKDGTKKVIKPEKFELKDPYFAEPGSYINPVDIKWFDEDQILLGTGISTANGLNWTIESLSSPISLNKAISKETAAETSSSGEIDTYDVKRVDGKYLGLVLTNYPSDLGATATVKDLLTGEILWNKSFNGSFDGFTNSTMLSEDGRAIYGGAQAGDGVSAFVYNNTTDKTYFPEGSIIFKLQ